MLVVHLRNPAPEYRVDRDFSLLISEWGREGRDRPAEHARDAYMIHGHTGRDMGRMAEVMPYPRNTISMKGAVDPFGDYISMGGLLTILKVRDDLRTYDEAPGWYRHPPGTVALRATEADLVRHGIDVRAGTSAHPPQPARPGTEAPGDAHRH